MLCFASRMRVCCEINQTNVNYPPHTFCEYQIECDSVLALQSLKYRGTNRKTSP
jgi:hypothetical protein